MAVRDDRRFYRDLGRMLRTAGRILVRYRAAAEAYRRCYPELVSDAHWHRQLGTGLDAGRVVVEAAATRRTSGETGYARASDG